MKKGKDGMGKEGSRKHEIGESAAYEKKERKEGKKDPKGSFGAKMDKMIGRKCK